MKNKWLGLEAKGICYEVNRTPILDNFSARMEMGHLNVVTGPNGSGKTTLLRLLSGDILPTSGIISCNGKSIRKWTVSELSRFRAVLPQQSQLDFPFTVEQVVAMGREPFSTDYDDEVLKAVLGACSLESFRQRIYTGLSGGEKQRVQIARVLAQIWLDNGHAGRFLFLDEPVNQLDIRYQHKIMQLIARLVQDGLGVCVVLHDLRLAQYYADSVYLLDNGKLVASGKFSDVIHADSLMNTFGVTEEQAGISSA